MLGLIFSEGTFFFVAFGDNKVWMVSVWPQGIFSLPKGPYRYLLLGRRASKSLETIN